MTMAPLTGTLTIPQVRELAAAALAPIASDDPAVHPTWVDALDPPALMLGWGDPWLDPFGVGRFKARLVVWCVGSRVDVGAGIDQLETLVPYVIERMAADPYPWGLPTTSAPRIYPTANVEYLAAQVAYLVAVSTEPEA